MGMSASQIRYCMLTGKKSDVEFQGQQINQQRTTLATETAAYNSQLLNLTVPTPPSADSYSKTTYTFSSNGETRTVTGTVYNSISDATTGAQAGLYTVNYTTKSTTSQGQSAGSSLYVNEDTTGTNPQYKVYSGSAVGNALTLAVADSTAVGYSATDAQNIALIEKDCGISKYTTSAGNSLRAIPADPNATNYNAVDLANLQSIFGTSYSGSATYYKYITGAGATAQTHYVAASDIAASGTTGTAKSYVSGEVAGPTTGTALSLNQTQFYKYTQDGTVKYVLSTDLANFADTTTAVSSFAVDPNATVTNSAKMINCHVSWSNTGRMSKITDSEGTAYTLSVATANDTDAYNAAYNEYEYQKGKYNKTMNDINAQIQLIESQDKKLELQLKNLDTQQQAISTEMESVKKVIDKNVESSFKAFG